MTCEATRQNDEMFCVRWDLRWDAGSPPPAGARCLVGNRKKDPPMTVTENPETLTEEQVTIRLGLLLVSPDSCGYVERQAIVRAMQVAINPDATETDLYLANNEVLQHFPWLKNVRRRHPGVE